MRKLKASDFATSYEFKQAQKAERQASRNARNSRANGRGKAFAIVGSDE